jgi:cellulose synthase/poly-beta-1,6-N-acetylglucosamine synthase-like glycosyltransferase
VGPGPLPRRVPQAAAVLIALQTFIYILDALVVTYFLAYAGVNLALLAISAVQVRRTLQRAQVAEKRGRREVFDEAFAPLISLVAPAYNEEVTMVESVRSLLRLNYPQYEIILVNDGSKDNTVGVLKEAFKFVRSDVDYNPHLGTMPIRGFYRSTVELPAQVVRLVLVDKDNGGKADAINAGINASQGTYVATMDADSLMIEEALRVTVQPILDDPNRVIACGGQIALSNGCRVEGGRVVEVRLPRPWIARFQVVEYMRSFTQGRTALGQVNALLILSGVFAVFQRESLISAGGFLTRHMRSRIGQEYCGVGAETVCEDMEVVVRMHRYVIDHTLDGRVVFLPQPTSWTEAPEVYKNLGKQRSRWYRGLLEVLWIHRRVLFRPRYGRIGLFALPYQLFFEAMAPVLETLGYLVLPLSWAVGLLSPRALLSFLALAMAFTFFLSAGSISVAMARVRMGDPRQARSLFEYRGVRPYVVLLVAGLLSNLGYRQYLLYWQLKGLKDFLKKRKSWDKFERKGFASPKSTS